MKKLQKSHYSRLYFEMQMFEMQILFSNSYLTSCNKDFDLKLKGNK